MPIVTPKGLIIGAFYRQKPNAHGMTYTDRPMRYLGTTLYGGDLHYEFWDDHTRLRHWCNPEDMEWVRGPG